MGWTANEDEAGGRRRGPPDRHAADGLHRSAPAGDPSAPAGPAATPEVAPGPTDVEMEDRVAAGDATALAVLYDRYSPQVYALALAIVGEQGGAEEVLIETFYRLWADAAPATARRRPLAGRLLRLARELAVAEARRRHLIGPDPGGWPSVFLPAPAGSPADDDRRVRVVAALAALSADQRRALELAYFDGLGEREIAERLGRSVGQARLLLRLAFERLGDHLRGAEAGDEPGA